MKTRKNFKKIILISILCLIVIVLLLYFAVPHIIGLIMQPEKDFSKEINSIATESEDIPYIESYGSLYKEKEIISVYGLCDKQNKDFENMLCIFNNSIYFVYTEQSETEKAWCVASVDMETLEIHTHFKLKNPAAIYNSCPIPGDFKKINGYCYDKKIVLNDYKTVLEYDLTSQSTVQYAYNEYNFPAIKVFGSAIDYETIRINTELGEKTFTLKEISQKSSGIATIYSYKNRFNWENKPYITTFFKETSVQYVDGIIYVIGEIRDYYGQAYSIVMSYDELSDSWKYITNIYTNDNGYCYILPASGNIH